jgi:hypothetical protein
MAVNRNTKVVSDTSLKFSIDSKNSKSYRDSNIVSASVLYIDSTNKTSYDSGSDPSLVYNIQDTTLSGTFTNGAYVSQSVFTFDGTDDYVNFGDNLDTELSGDYTVQVWMKCRNTTTNGFILSKRQSADNDAPIIFGCAEASRTNNIYWTIGDIGVATRVMINENNVWDFDTWTNIAITIEGTTPKLYKNGVIHTTGTTYTGTRPTNNTGDLEFGKVSSSRFKGDLALLKVYDRALSATEILQNYNASSNNPPFLNNPSKITDMASNTISGSLVNGILFTDNVWNFDGTDDKINLPTIAPFDADFSIEMWVYLNPLSDGDTPTIFSQRGSADATGLSFGVDNRISSQTRTLQLGIKIGSERASPGTGNDNFPTSTWTHVVVTVADIGGGQSTVTYYVDNIVLKTHTYTTARFSNTQLAGIGVTKDTTADFGFWDGNISQLRYYNRALTAEEIKQNYNTSKHRYI